MPEKRSALGRGLDALIPKPPPSAARDTTTEIDVDLLRPNPYQPRMQLDEGKLAELTASIKSTGLIQPLVVRTREGGYEIIAGERRWRAAQRAGLLKVPIVVREVPDDQVLQVALIENIQREELNPIDEALAYQRLVEDFQLRQEEIASAVGKDRSSVANYLRLLKLTEDVRAYVAQGSLSMGHARALLGLSEPAQQRRAARDVIDRGLSVRQTEHLVKKLSTPRTEEPELRKDVHTRHAEQQLKLSLGTPVRIVRRGQRGRIEIDFVSESELQRLYEHLTG